MINVIKEMFGVQKYEDKCRLLSLKCFLDYVSGYFIFLSEDFGKLCKELDSTNC